MLDELLEFFIRLFGSIDRKRKQAEQAKLIQDINREVEEVIKTIDDEKEEMEKYYRD